MVLDKSIETLEDLVRFLNRKQSFYFKLYNRYLEGDLSDYDHLDDSRKDEVDCNAVCDDIVECIKAISEEAQVRGLAKKAKVLCTLDGQDEERCILDEWLLKVVRLLDDDANWNRMLAPIEGEDMNNVFYAILFRLTYVVNFLNELSTKTEQEYYGGRRTDVMPYYIGESKLKETSTILLRHHHKTELPNSSAPVRDGCSKCGDRSPDKVLQALKYWCDDFNIEDISAPEDNERICVDCFKKICKDRGVRLGKKHWGMREGVTSDKSIRDFVKEEYINKEWTICPPEKPNGNWTWSKDSYVKPGEDACQLSDILSSIGIQETLLNTTTDVICVANLAGWKDLAFYIKLPQNIVDAIKAMPEKYYNYRGKILPASKLKTFVEGDYIAFGGMSSGSCKKESISRNLQNEFGDFSEDEAIKIMVCKFTGEYYLKDLYGDTKKSVEQIGKMFYQFVMDNQIFHTIRDLLFMASDLWYESLENEKIAKQKKDDEAKAKKEAIKQSYIDWVEEGNPTYMREGFAYKGAKATPIDVDDAVVRIQNDQPFEYKWETINGEKALVLQYYSENDMW